MDQQAVEIAASVKRILETVPPDVIVVAAAKGRTLAEVEAAIQAGITHVGHNYVQEARAMILALGDNVTWHMIGHLQRNKVKKAMQLFDLIETVDSWRLAEALDRRCAVIGKVLPVLVEINSGWEISICSVGWIQASGGDIAPRGRAGPALRRQSDLPTSSRADSAHCGA
jgi:uncharacterized pyridoxal phosphate-containing UPF0001 family protein